MRLLGMLFVLAFVAAVVAVYVLELVLLVGFIVRRGQKRCQEPFLRRTLSGAARKRFLTPFLPRWGVMAVHGLAILGLACVAWGFFVEPYRLEVTHTTIPTRKLRQTSLRIVHISDTHCDWRIYNESRLAPLIDPLAPDIIVFTGDALNDRAALPRFQETLRGLHAAMGKFAVRGNIDAQYFGDLDLFANTGFTQLDADCVELDKDGERIRLLGIDSDRRDRAEAVARQAQPGSLNIFLCHFPSVIEQVRGRGIDAYLAGHTHGGQVCLPFYGAIITFSRTGKRYESGLYRVGRTALYVNRGLGMEGAGWAPPVRFWCRPEIAVLDLVPAGGRS